MGNPEDIDEREAIYNEIHGEGPNEMDSFLNKNPDIRKFAEHPIIQALMRIPRVKGMLFRIALGMGQQAAVEQLKGAKEENTLSAQTLRQKLKELHEQMELAPFDGSVDLGIDPEMINWAEIPEELVAVLQAEFSYEPETISAFRVRKFADSDRGFQGVSLELERQGKPWSQVKFTVRESSGSVDPSHSHRQDQARDAIQAAKELDSTLWRRDEELEMMEKNHRHSEDSLQLTERFLQFVAREMERQRERAEASTES